MRSRSCARTSRTARRRQRATGKQPASYALTPSRAGAFCATASPPPTMAATCFPTASPSNRLMLPSARLPGSPRTSVLVGLTGADWGGSRGERGEPMPDGSVTELVGRARGGDQSAWNELVERYSRLLWSVARAHRLPQAESADVVQMTWLLLVENLD